MTTSFWTRMDQLIAGSELTIDRPAGTTHPRRGDIVYPLDYGYLEGTSGGDGDGIDVWRGTRADPVFDAVVCTVDTHKRDGELKLLLGCTEEEKRLVCRFHESHGMGALLVTREIGS